MTALTDDRKTQQMEGIEVALPVGASKEIFAGGLVVLDGTTGYAEAGADAATKIFAGVAREHVNNTGAAGDKKILRCKGTGYSCSTRHLRHRLTSARRPTSWTIRPWGSQRTRRTTSFAG